MSVATNDDVDHTKKIIYSDCKRGTEKWNTAGYEFMKWRSYDYVYSIRNSDRISGKI